MTISPLAAAALRVINAASMNGTSCDLASQAAYALESAQMLQPPETAAEAKRLRSRVAELEQHAATARELHSKYPDSEHCQHDGEPWPCPTLRAIAGDDNPKSPWQRAVDGLNALVDAGIGFHVEPDGHISNPCGDEHIEWDRTAERWRLVHDEDDADEEPHPAPCQWPASPDCACAGPVPYALTLHAARELDGLAVDKPRDILAPSPTAGA